MDTAEPVPELTGDLDHWEVNLKSGEVVNVRAHGVREEADAWVFVALMKGSPPYEYELARFPREAVQAVEGGWPRPPA